MNTKKTSIIQVSILLGTFCLGFIVGDLLRKKDIESTNDGDLNIFDIDNGKYEMMLHIKDKEHCKKMIRHGYTVLRVLNFDTNKKPVEPEKSLDA